VIKPGKTSIAMLIVAVALLVVGIAGPARRAYDERERARATAALAERVAQERTVIAADYAANRDRILADVRAAIDRGDAAGAMALAARYVPGADDALRELHREAANTVSLRQRAEQYAALVRRECAEDLVRDRVTRMLAAAFNAGAAAEGTPLVRRLQRAEARDVVLARIREPVDPEREDTLHPHGAAAPAAGSATAPGPERNVPVLKGPVDWVTRMRQDNRARPLPDYLGMLYSPLANDVICAWRVEGRRRDGSRVFAYTMDVWMAPTPDSKNLTADPVRYVERPV
jgi:hypothetical protein